MHNKTDRSSGIFSHINRNVVHPFYNLTRPLNNESSLEIIELHSDDEQENDEQDGQKNTATSYNAHKQDTEELHSININSNNSEYYRQIYDNIIDYEAIRSIYTEFYDNDCYNIGNIDRNCSNLFTFIVDEQVESSLDEDNFEDFKANKQRSSGNIKKSYKKDLYHEDLDLNENDVWIYAFKNGGYLTDLNEIFDEIQSADTSSSQTDDERDKTMKKDNICRVPTPIPHYIPRLILPLNTTLSTVTEVTEPRPSISNVCCTDDNNKSSNGYLCENQLKSNVTKYINKDLVWTPLKQSKEKKKHKHITRNLKFDENKYTKIKPGILTNSWCSIIKQNPPEPEIKMNLKSQKSESTNDKNISFEGNFQKDHNMKQSNMVKNENDFIKSLQLPSVKFTANIKSDSNKITLLFEKIETNDNNNDRNLITCDDNSNKTDIQTNLNSNNNVNEIPVESFKSSQFVDNTDASRTTEYKLSFLTNSDSEIQTSWFKKILKYCKCCK